MRRASLPLQIMVVFLDGLRHMHLCGSNAKSTLLSCTGQEASVHEEGGFDIAAVEVRAFEASASHWRIGHCSAMSNPKLDI